MTMSAIIPKLYPKPCPTQVNCQEASTHQLWVLYLALLLTSIGTGGIRPCVVTFAANQFDMTKSGVASRKWNYFNLYYFCMGLATLTALTVIVYIQNNVGWGWGLGIPTISMGLSFIAFVVGYPLYYKPKPGGSPLVRMCQVVVAAWKKRNVLMPNHADLLYHNKQLDALISVDGRLLHTEQFKWLDRAAIATEGETKESIPRNLWNISTVHRVEEQIKHQQLRRMGSIENHFWGCSYSLSPDENFENETHSLNLVAVALWRKMANDRLGRANSDLDKF
ncbi:protein NRT1/ PTR FAMILY 3.1-like [Silene latifolia]|uniref:protein NRT1/ PTR FAMILY 3.1-like n=1 Tax=Silene latifolia TaxID=37657 RepID=UPI003D7824F5